MAWPRFALRRRLLILECAPAAMCFPLDPVRSKYHFHFQCALRSFPRSCKWPHSAPQGLHIAALGSSSQLLETIHLVDEVQTALEPHPMKVIHPHLGRYLNAVIYLRVPHDQMVCLLCFAKKRRASPSDLANHPQPADRPLMR